MQGGAGDLSKKPALAAPAVRQPPHAELESGASVGTSDLEVKKTTRVRVTPRRTKLALESGHDRRGDSRGRAVHENGPVQTTPHCPGWTHLCGPSCRHAHRRWGRCAICCRPIRRRGSQDGGRVARLTGAVDRESGCRCWWTIVVAAVRPAKSRSPWYSGADGGAGRCADDHRRYGDEIDPRVQHYLRTNRPPEISRTQRASRCILARGVR